jgi:hypothetical protein
MDMEDNDRIINLQIHFGTVETSDGQYNWSAIAIPAVTLASA